MSAPRGIHSFDRPRRRSSMIIYYCCVLFVVVIVVLHIVHDDLRSVVSTSQCASPIFYLIAIYLQKLRMLLPACIVSFIVDKGTIVVYL